MTPLSGGGGARSRPRYLPGPGALQSRPFCQSQWAAVAELNVAGADPLGRSGVGAAVSTAIVPISALLPAVWASASAVDRASTTGITGGPALAAGAHPGGGSR